MSNEFSNTSTEPSEPWSRLWLPVDEWDRQRDIDDDFLSEHWGKNGIEHAFDGPLPGIGLLGQFAAKPFLMLLGRPGSGKSKELRKAKQQGLLGPAVLLEAKEIGAAPPGIYLSSLIPEPPAGTALRIIIDGLDEALLQNPLFVPQLKAWLRQRSDAQGRPLHPLAISCRWADWPQAQVEELANLWVPNDAKTLILCPLIQKDVINTLRSRFGERAELFWKQMNDLHLRHVACWPLGLLGLMHQFQDSGFKRLASSHAEVVQDQVVRQCRLADTPDDTVRWEKSAQGSEWRQRVAGRVAVAMIWSGKAQLDLAASGAQPSSEALAPSELAFGTELLEGQRKSVILADLSDLVRQTSLMKRLPGRERWVFESQVHQEWLAADWLAKQNLDLARLEQIFGSVVNGKWVICPALKATAAWLARFDKEFREHVLSHDPLVLLRMDGASLPERERKEVVEKLLEATHSIRVVDSGIRQAHLPSLKHPELLEQLTRWLTNTNACDEAKELAIEIAEKTEFTDLSELLWRLFPETVGRLQIEIAGSLFRLARDGHDEKWLSVLRNEIPADQRGRIVGAALDVLVIKSQRVPLRDVLDWVLPERRFEDGVWDIYQFSVRRIHEQMTVDDLPLVFAKLSAFPHSIHDSFSRAGELNEVAIRLAIGAFERPDIRQSFVDYWHSCLRHHVPPHHDYNKAWSPGEIGLEDDSKRREIICALFSHPAFLANTERKWLSTDDYLLFDHDFDWCLEQILAAAPEDEWRFSLAVASLVRRTDLSGELGYRLIEVWNRSSALRKLLPTTDPGENIIDAITRVAKNQQDKRERETRSWAKKRANTDAIFQKKLIRYTQECREAHEQGKLVWPGVENILGARLAGPGSRTVTFEQISNIGPHEEWMVEAAKQYLTNCMLMEGKEYDQGLYALLALAACPEILDAEGPVRTSIESRWLSLLIEQLSGHGLGEAPEGVSLERLATIFPEAFSVAFGHFCRKRYAKGDSMRMLRSFHKCWLPQMTILLQETLSEEPPQPEGFFNGMCFLASRNEDSATAVALKKLQALSNGAQDTVKAAVVGVAAFLLSGRLAAEVECHIRDHTLLAVAMRAAARRLEWTESRMDFTKWPKFALKALANACWQAMPRLERSSYGGGEFRRISDEDQAMELRDRISSAARSRGIDVTIPTEHQDDDEEDARQRQQTIRWHQHAAIQARAAEAWAHILPEDFFKLTSRRHARLARNQDELLSAVVECLRLWQVDLTAGAWDHLWDIRSCTSRPEKRIAREMRDWLHERLDVMVEREIELASEDRTDVVVQTHPGDITAPKLTLVIEVKKYRSSNSKERKTAMKTQLLDRYLRARAHEGWTHGLYVIVWTPPPGTKHDSYEIIAETRHALEEQAEALSVPPFKLESMVIDARFQDNCR